MRDRVGIVTALGVLAVLCAIAPLVGEFWSGVLARCVSWMFLAISFSLAYSYANIPSVAQATVFGAGAYAAVWATSLVGGNMILIMVAGVAAGALIALVFGALLLKMSHSGAAIGTIIFAVTFSMLGNAAVAYTGGTDGLPMPAQAFHLLGMPFAVGPNIGMLLLGSAVLAALLVAFWLFSGTRTWRVVRAVQHVAIEVVSLSMSLKSILWAAVGGVTSIYGGPIGVLAVQLASELLLRWTVRVDLIIGLMLIAVALWMPRGVMGLRRSRSSQQSQ
jgi:ABC-type branched-subunit amino acid transport system permease subunit